MTPDQKNASRRATSQLKKFEPPQEPTATLEEQVEYYKARLAELEGQNRNLTAQLKQRQIVVNGKRKRLKELNAELLNAEQKGQALKSEIAAEEKRQKHEVYKQKRAIANGGK